MPSESSNEEWSPQDGLADTARLHLEEARHMRDALDTRIDETLNRSLSLLGLFGTALAVAAALGGTDYHAVWLTISAALFGVGLGWALWCQKPRPYVPGPDVPSYLEDELTKQQPTSLAVRDLAHELYNIREDNSRDVLAPVLRSFRRQTLFLGLAVMSLLMSAVFSDSEPEVQREQETEAPSSTSTSVSPSSN